MSNTSASEENDSGIDSSESISSGSSSYEKWLVRILLTLAFGLAFGIEGMTLIRSFVLEDEEPSASQTATNQGSLLQEGDLLMPSLGPPVRAHRLGVRAGSEEWTFTLIARPDTAPVRSYTLTFDRLTTTDGTARPTAPSHTWSKGDTVAFAASWVLPVGQRPDVLTMTATTKISPESTATASRTVEFGHVPIRQ